MHLLNPEPLAPRGRPCPALPAGASAPHLAGVGRWAGVPSRPRGRRRRGARCRQPQRSGAASAGARCECGAGSQRPAPAAGAGSPGRAGSGRVSPAPCPALCAARSSRRGCAASARPLPASSLRPPPPRLSSLPSVPRWLWRGAGAALLPWVCFLGGASGRCHGAGVRLCRGDLPLPEGLLDVPLLYINYILILGIYRCLNKCLRTFEL